MRPYTDIEQSRLFAMTQEEKARRFDEALRMAREQHQYHWVRRSKDVLEEIFPELRESGDEKIRKIVYGWINTQPSSFFDLNGLSKEDMFAWLEKQGEQKSANKVEPKFKVGDWVVCDCNNVSYSYIESISETKYNLQCIDGSHEKMSVEYVDRCWHLWTIQDAKDGDVLQLGGVTAIFKEYITCRYCKCYCSIYDGEFEIPSQNDDDDIYGCYHATPATKEQRDLLFQKMKEVDYEFDFEKKELKNTDKESVLPQVTEDYNPYEAAVKSIAKMCKRYDRMDLDSLQDFYDNVKVKCKDAQEYDYIWGENCVKQ